MVAKQIKDGLPIEGFADQKRWEVWLEYNHSSTQGIWLKIAKKDAGISTVAHTAAVESALCYGWIDSQISAYDSQYYLNKFTPRRAKSKWSKMNCEKAEALIASGRMQPSGYKQIQLAKADGRWEAAYDPQSRIQVPQDFLRELGKNPMASEFFTKLNSVNRYAILHRIQVAKKPETRERRIRQFASMLADQQKIYP